MLRYPDTFQAGERIPVAPVPKQAIPFLFGNMIRPKPFNRCRKILKILDGHMKMAYTGHHVRSGDDCWNPSGHQVAVAFVLRGDSMNEKPSGG